MTDNEGAGISRDGSNLARRVLAAAVLIPAALFLTWAGVLPFLALVLLLVALMAHEWAAIVHDGDRSQFALHAVAGAAGAFAGLVHGVAPALWLAVLFAWGGSVWLTARSMKGFTIFHLTGIPYLALPAFALVALRAGGSCGFPAVLLLFVTVWSADTLAYFAGRTFGGPKFAPRISPNKTWSGFFGAVAGGALAAALLAAFSGLAVLPLALLGAVLGGWEQVGDLFESAAKRRFGVKDSGSIIPGHGGVLDRVDGLVAAAVLALVWGAWASGTLHNAACGILFWWDKT